MAVEESKQRTRVLDPIERVSEIIFGVLMALTFTGSLSVATAGSQEVRTMMITALGCNIAWGLTDAVMYLVGTAVERQRGKLAAVGASSAGLGARDYTGALGVFLLVVLATFPVVIPFLFIADVGVALRVSNGLALATLFIGGYMLGKYAGGRAWKYGLAMAAIGAVLVVIIIALGG